MAAGEEMGLGPPFVNVAECIEDVGGGSLREKRYGALSLFLSRLQCHGEGKNVLQSKPPKS
jgi:hypothetical protein